MLKNFFMKKMLQSQLKNVPKEQQEMILTLVEKNPELFQKIAVEVQAKMKEGKNQMTAAMEVMRAHQDELSAIMGKKS